ncbi:hypothetical protein KKG29_00015 [Patescibacteria group bacterium]|nr:hypothetical protein [Patescibacteria group bacterium]MBU3999555.1 hypothetical protein [Patescibacteria group bacterium]MBU4056897.1 hypothetical protein [Patescibacteria group bacterium]MBU4368575.1 hypothetical protein [Patescibacteria group bacterium]
MLIVESLKQFLKPELRKVLILIIFFSLSLLYKWDLPRLMNIGIVNDAPNIARGLPLPFITEGCNFVECGYFPLPFPYLQIFLIIDIIFWYLISCLVIFTWDKIKNKNK